MDKGKLKGHTALWAANLIWGLNAPIGKSVLWSESNFAGVWLVTKSKSRAQLEAESTAAKIPDKTVPRQK